MTGPFVYTCGGVLVDSTLPLPDLAVAHGADPGALVIRVLPGAQSVGGTRVFEWAEPAVILDRAADGWVFRLPSAGIAIDVNSAGTILQVDCGPRAIDEACEFVAKRVLPRVLDFHGRLLLHGSTVAVTGPHGQEGAVAFLGRSHAGKSTLAMALGIRSDCTLLGDDTAVLERRDDQWLVHGSNVSSSLRHDSGVWFGGHEAPLPGAADDKVRFQAGHPVRGPRRLHAVYLLDEGPEVEIDPLSKYDAIRHAIKHVVRFNPGDWPAEAVRMARIHTLVQEVPVARLLYPRTYDRLDEVCDTIVNATAVSLGACTTS